MFKFLRSWSAGKLFASWVAYWLLLGALTLGPAAAAIWRATHAEKGKGSFSMSFGNGAISLDVLDTGATIYHGSIHFLPLTLLLAGPPLLLWLAWFASRSKRTSPDAMVGR